MQDDLTTVKDDMMAFIMGHGMRRFPGYVTEEVASIPWGPEQKPDDWKDMVELAKAAGASFLTMNDVVLERKDVDSLVERLSNSDYTNDEDLDEARWLRTYVGKTGFIQLGWPYQGVMFIYEMSTEWYDSYQRLMDIAEEFGGSMISDSDLDDEK